MYDQITVKTANSQYAGDRFAVFAPNIHKAECVPSVTLYRVHGLQQIDQFVDRLDPLRHPALRLIVQEWLSADVNKRDAGRQGGQGIVDGVADQHRVPRSKSLHQRQYRGRMRLFLRDVVYRHYRVRFHVAIEIVVVECHERLDPRPGRHDAEDKTAELRQDLMRHQQGLLGHQRLRPAEGRFQPADLLPETVTQVVGLEGTL